MDGSCSLCPFGCEMCSSATICSKCRKGFELANNVCSPACPFPCATCTNSTVTLCQTCFGGYSLTNGVCNGNTDCTATASCTVCPSGLTLNNNICVQCGTNCISCNVANVAECKLCNNVTFLTTAKVCSSCVSPCGSCRTSEFCLSCAGGFYM